MKNIADAREADGFDVLYNSNIYVGDRPTDRLSGRPRDLKRIYFYYIKFDSNNRLICREYEFPSKNGLEHSEDIGEALLMETLERYLDDVSNAPLTCEDSFGFDDVKWHGPSYLAFLFDEDGWDYLKNSKGVYDALHFQNFDKYWHNKTFYNAKVLTVSEKRILICENYHFKALPSGQGPARRENDKGDDYKFDIYLTAPLCSRDADRKTTIVIDPTGTNFGPP